MAGFEKESCGPKFRLAAIILIAVLAFASYANILNGEFVWDDIEQVSENPVIKDIGNIPSFFTTDLWRLIDNPTIGSYYYRPIFLLSFAVDYQLWGLNPFGYHLTNTALHLISSLLVFAIGVKVLRSDIAAAFGAAIFAVHPAHVESVSWISGRTDPLAAVFLLLSIFLYIIFTERGGASALLALSASAASFFLSLLTKEMGVTLPAILLLFVISFMGRRDAKKGLAAIALYVAALVLYFFIRSLMLGSAVGSVDAAPLDKRIYTSFGIILDYIRILVLPVNLKTLYDVPVEGAINLKVISSALALITIFTAASLAYFKDKRVFFLSLWFFVTIVPVSNIVPLRPTMMAERYLYIPSVGVALLTGLAFSYLYRARVKAAIALGVLVAAFLLYTTVERNRAWASEIALFESMATSAPLNAYTHHNLGDAYRKAGRMELAVQEWEKAVQIDPMHYEANNSLANMALLRGDYALAIERYNKALAVRPESAEAHYNLALALDGSGRPEEAAYHYREFLKRAPAKFGDVIDEVRSRLGAGE